MKNISRWAALNPWKARFFIAAGHMALAFLAFILSGRINASGIILPATLLPASFILFALLTFTYPGKKNYYSRKSFDIVFAAIGFIQLCCFFQALDTDQENIETVYGATIVHDSSFYHNPKAEQIINKFRSDHQKITRSEGRILIKELKFQSRKYMRTKEPPEAKDHTLEIIAIILLAILLSMGIGLLACGIACGGAEGLALLVLIGGIVVSIIMAWQLIRNVNRKKAREAQQPDIKTVPGG